MDFHLFDHLSGVAGEDWAGSAVVPVQPFVAPCDPPLVLSSRGSGVDVADWRNL